MIKYLPKSVVGLLVKIKGTGVLEKPKLVKSENPNSLACVIAYNKYGAFCTLSSCANDTPVQATYRGEQYEEKTIE